MSMRKIRYFDWKMEISYDTTIVVHKNGEVREYTTPDKITKIVHDEEYVYLTLFDRTLLQLKFEDDDFFVGDLFYANGEHKDTFACHEFYLD